MEIIYKKLDELTPYANNPRNNDGKAVEQVAASIEEFGFKVPLVIDEGGVIVTGHTRYKAAHQLSMTAVPCIVASDLTPEQIKAFRIADNKVADFSTWDNALLLKELKDLDGLFTGFELSEMFNAFEDEVTSLDKLDDLDEQDNSDIENNKYGVVYILNFKTQSKALFSKIKSYIESEGDIEEE